MSLRNPKMAPIVNFLGDYSDFIQPLKKTVCELDIGLRDSKVAYGSIISNIDLDQTSR